MLRSYNYRYYRPLILLGLYVSISAKMRIATGESFIGSDTGSTGIKALFNNVYSDFGQIASLLGGSAYIAGLIFTVAAMFKVKQHRDNPTQVSISHALIFLLAGIGLIFLPSTLQQGATTIFTSIDSGYAGVSTTNIDNNPWAKPGVQN